MKKMLLMFGGLLLISDCFSQNNPEKKPSAWIRPYVETGITFIKNENLKNTYATNSIYNWGAGLRIGNFVEGKRLLFLQYSNSTFITQRINSKMERLDSALKIEEYLVGFILPLKRINENMIRVKVGFIYSIIQDDLFNNSKEAQGLQLGLGYEAKVFKNSRLYIDYSYDFIKLKKAVFRDYDIQKIAFGFIL